MGLIIDFRIKMNAEKLNMDMFTVRHKKYALKKLKSGKPS